VEDCVVIIEGWGSFTLQSNEWSSDIRSHGLALGARRSPVAGGGCWMCRMADMMAGLMSDDVRRCPMSYGQWAKIFIALKLPSELFIVI
jgi:hypothetical protein